jgi:hypothetical protein
MPARQRGPLRRQRRPLLVSPCGARWPVRVPRHLSGSRHRHGHAPRAHPAGGGPGCAAGGGGRRSNGGRNRRASRLRPAHGVHPRRCGGLRVHEKLAELRSVPGEGLSPRRPAGHRCAADQRPRRLRGGGDRGAAGPAGGGERAAARPGAAGKLRHPGVRLRALARAGSGRAQPPASDRVPQPLQIPADGAQRAALSARRTPARRPARRSGGEREPTTSRS